MTELERFEKLVSSEPFGYALDKTPFGYKLFAVNELRAMWVAARADAFGDAHEQLSVAGNETKTPQRI